MGYTIRYYVTVVTVILGGSAQFYSYGVVNPAQRLIMDWINQTYVERNGSPIAHNTLNFLWSAIVSSIAVGAIIGALLTRTISERFGRRNGLIMNGILNVFGALMEFIAKPAGMPELLLFGRFILGINMGLTSGLCPIYLMEITPAKKRGIAGTLHQVASSFSDWFSLFIALPEILGSAKFWPYAFALPGLPALMLVFILPFSPESPKWLMSREDRMGALDSIRKLIGEEKSHSMYEEIVMEQKQEENERPATFCELFTATHLRAPLVACCLVMFAQQFTGCAAVFAYSTSMFLNAKLDESTAHLATLAIGITYFVSTCCSPLLIERAGRRPLLLFQLSACFVTLGALTVFTGMQNYSASTWASRGTIGALVAYMCVYGVGSPIPWMITAELFSQRFRSTAVTVSATLLWFLTFISSALYLPFSELVGVTFSYFPFLIGLIATTIALFFLLPETRYRVSPSAILDAHKQANLQ